MKKYTNKMVIESLEIPMITDIESLAFETRLTKKLIYYLSKNNAVGRYKTFKIPKKNGKLRVINAPCLSLKILQRWILENILYKTKLSPYSIGFDKKSKKSPIVRCAEKHKNHLYILKMDLCNFFPSIDRGRIYKIFLLLGYNSYASNLLTNICTLEGKLPQGAVTSPYLANLVCYNLDVRIAGYCNKRGIAYSRYADDLIFSCDNRDLLHRIYGMIKMIVIEEGFTVNDDKTRFLTPKVRKEILGLTVNEGKIKAAKELKRKIRAMIHYSIVTGDYSKNDQILGYISYVNSVEKNYLENIVKYIEKYRNKDIANIKEVVEGYNNNILIKSIPKIEYKENVNISYNKDERMIFFKKHNLTC